MQTTIDNDMRAIDNRHEETPTESSGLSVCWQQTY